MLETLNLSELRTGKTMIIIIIIIIMDLNSRIV